MNPVSCAVLPSAFVGKQRQRAVAVHGDPGGREALSHVVVYVQNVPRDHVYGKSKYGLPQGRGSRG